VVASHFPHFGEENCLRGWNGSGTIFFSGCNLRCVFCQNFDISWEVQGERVTPQRLAGMMLELQARGCHNINFVAGRPVGDASGRAAPWCRTGLDRSQAAWRVGCGAVSAGHVHDLPAGEPSGAVAEALAEVEAGQIAYLTRAGQPVAALVPVTELAQLQHASDTAAIGEAEAVQARPGPRIPHEVVEAMMGADEATHDAMAAALDARAGEDLPPEQVTALWETIRTRRGA
jgi:antitoxin (DNA-binding transcriptional repressor) of toxin-antitoxin stability system